MVLSKIKAPAKNVSCKRAAPIEGNDAMLLSALHSPFEQTEHCTALLEQTRVLLGI